MAYFEEVILYQNGRLGMWILSKIGRFLKCILITRRQTFTFALFSCGQDLEKCMLLLKRTAQEKMSERKSETFPFKANSRCNTGKHPRPHWIFWWHFEEFWRQGKNEILHTRSNASCFFTFSYKNTIRNLRKINSKFNCYYETRHKGTEVGSEVDQNYGTNYKRIYTKLSLGCSD